MSKIFTSFLLSILIVSCFQKEQKLKGTPISLSCDSQSREKAFDEDSSTEFKSALKSDGWVGLKFDLQYIITKIGWLQKQSNGADYILGIFEGANEESFIDSVPLYMIKEKGLEGEMNYVTIEVTKPFKYVRYVGPADKYSVISEFEVYGYQGEDKAGTEDEQMYQPTNIPVMVINTENNEVPVGKEKTIPCNINIIDNGKLKSTKATVRLRGNTSMQVEKKGYRINFETKYNPLDFPHEGKKFNLVSSYFDKSLIRNLLGYKISSIFEMPYTITCKPLDIIFNGDYKGNYLLCEQVEVKRYRVPITQMSEEDIYEPEVSGGYLLEIDGYGLYNDGYSGTKKGLIYGIKYPKEEDIKPEQKAYIENYMNEMEQKVYENNMDFIDIDSYANYFLVNEFIGDSDSLWSSYYINKERNDNKLHFGPFWDFDLTFDNEVSIYSANTKNNFIFKFGEHAGTIMDFTIKLVNNSDVFNAIKERWEYMKLYKLLKDDLFEYIDDTVEYIKESAKLNFMRWNILNKRLLCGGPIKGTYEGEVDAVRQYVNKRFDTLTNLINRKTEAMLLEKVDTCWGYNGTWINCRLPY